MRRKILINHLMEPGNRITGISNYLFYLLDELLYGKEFEYILLTCWNEASLPDMLKGRGMTVVTLPYIESTPRNILSQLAKVPKLAGELDCVLEFNPNPLGCFIGSVPLVSTTHDLYFNLSPHSYKFHHRIWWKVFFPLTLRRANRNISVSNNTQKDLLNFYPWTRDKSCVVQEAACLSGGVKPVERSSFGLFVANVSPNKGTDVLIQAMGILEERGQLCDIFHIGRDSENYIEHYGCELNLSVSPIKLGYLSDEDLRVRYSQARFLVFPSSYEGFGLPILEAQKYGLPVIASDIGVLREVAGKGALYFDPQNAEQLAERIYQLLNDDVLFSKLSSEAILNERLFSWRKAARETENVFNAALAGH